MVHRWSGARRRVVSVLLGVFVALAVSHAPVHAASPDAATLRESEALIQKGLALREAGRDQEALPYFQRAYAVVPSPRAAAQLGFAEQALGLWVDAERHVGEALAASSDSWVQKYRGVIEESAGFIARQIGSLELDTNAKDAEVLVDGRLVGRTPLARPVRVAAGARRVQLRAAGFRPVEQAIAVTGGRSHQLSLHTPALPAAPVALPVAALGTVPSIETAASGSAENVPLYRRWWIWAGAAALVAGAVAIGVAASSGNDPFPCGADGRVCVR